MTPYCLPLSGTFALSVLFATTYPSNEPTLGEIQQHFGRCEISNDIERNSVVWHLISFTFCATPHCEMLDQEPDANPETFWSQYPGVRSGRIPLINRNEYLAATLGRGWIPSGTYRVNVGLEKSSIVVRFGRRADGSNDVARQVIQHHPRPEPSWFDQVTVNVQRNAAQSVYEREKRWQDYRNTIHQFLPRFEPQQEYNPHYPHVPSPQIE